MKPFKFFSRIEMQCIPLMTRDTDTTYHIPIDMYGHILQLAVDLHSENMTIASPVEYRAINEIGEEVTYLYKIENITLHSIRPNRIMIEYNIKFPDHQFYCNFVTTERIF